MISIHQNSKVFIAAPAGKATGGIELLHQLFYNLRLNGVEAYIFYFNDSRKHDYLGNNFKIHDFFLKYDVQYVFEIEDKSEHVLVIPEIVSPMLRHYSEIRKVIWWLSVDNYLKRITPAKLLVKLFNPGRENHLSMSAIRKLDVFHLCQSHYAKHFLIKNGIRAESTHMLSDSLNDLFLTSLPEKKGKLNQVVYNPKKGFRFTKKLIKAAPGLGWVPIQGMTPEQVMDLLYSSKVYIDFGNHPGKDRIPREAAMMGCCVIVGDRGSAGFQEDLPVPEEYRFSNDSSKITDIVDAIRRCQEGYDSEIIKFEGYRKFIRNEKDVFLNDIREIFNLG